MEETETRMELSIIIPCYNEKKTIRTIVEKILVSVNKSMEIIIVDDYSIDGTREILEKEIKPLVSKIIYHEKNQGKGAALRTGIKHATGKVTIIQDADLEYSPVDINNVIAPILVGEADVVYGSRFSRGTKRKGYFQNVLANKFLTWYSNLHTGLNLTDMETCYKCFKTELIQAIEIEENCFGFEPEITAKIAKTGAKILEVPISYNPRTKKEGKKINIKDGLRAIYVIRKYNN